MNCIIRTITHTNGTVESKVVCGCDEDKLKYINTDDICRLIKSITNDTAHIIREDPTAKIDYVVSDKGVTHYFFKEE